MDSVRYSEIVVAFGRGLRRLAEGVEAAADGELEGDERKHAIRAGREKLAEYEALIANIARDSQVLERQFVKRFDDDVSLIRESLTRIGPE